jgi:hypothetical protein
VEGTSGTPAAAAALSAPAARRASPTLTPARFPQSLLRAPVLRSADAASSDEAVGGSGGGGDSLDSGRPGMPSLQTLEETEETLSGNGHLSRGNPRCNVLSGMSSSSSGGIVSGRGVAARWPHLRGSAAAAADFGTLPSTSSSSSFKTASSEGGSAEAPAAATPAEEGSGSGEGSGWFTEEDLEAFLKELEEGPPRQLSWLCMASSQFEFETADSHPRCVCGLDPVSPAEALPFDGQEARV